MIGAVALILGTLGSFPSAAAAAPLSLPAPGGFTLQGSNGYTVEFVAIRAGAGRPSEVGVIASKPGAYVVYVAAGKVTPTTFEADFGALGKVAVAFHPSGGTVLAIPGCGPEETFPKGTYEGTIELQGEEGFTAVSATAVPGAFPDPRCGFFSEAVGGGLKGVVLSAFAYSESDESLLSFTAVKNHPRGAVVFTAEVAEGVGDVGIIRAVRAKGSRATLRYLPAHESAATSPPAPFSGSARYVRRKGHRPSWRGDLAVDFPGRAHVPLTGSDVEVLLTPHAEVHETPF